MSAAVTITKDHRERLIFERFARTAGLLGAGLHFESREPPEPDIFYRAPSGEKRAFELVEIIDQGYQGSSGLSMKTKAICQEFLQALPEPDGVKFRTKYSNADITLQFRPNFTLQRCRNALPKLFAALSTLPDNTSGDISTHDLDLEKEISFLHTTLGGRSCCRLPRTSPCSSAW